MIPPELFRYKMSKMLAHNQRMIRLFDKKEFDESEKEAIECDKLAMELGNQYRQFWDWFFNDTIRDRMRKS